MCRDLHQLFFILYFLVSYTTWNSKHGQNSGRHLSNDQRFSYLHENKHVCPSVDIQLESACMHTSMEGALDTHELGLHTGGCESHIMGAGI